VIFSVGAFLIANLGLSAIITYAVPVLMFLYPLAITLILLSLCSPLFGGKREVFVSATAFTLVAAALDGLAALPEGVRSLLHLEPLLAGAARAIPFFDAGFGWIVPAAVGLVLGLVIARYRKGTGAPTK
jgi:LIVCS family branched-chain amino acid:cation transporter